MRNSYAAICFVFILFCLVSGAGADAPDPFLHAKAQNYCDYVQQWASLSLGGVSEQEFHDDPPTRLKQLRGTGDSCIWTGMYLASQALRYMATGDEEARAEVLRIAAYLHIVKEITDTPGYIARYAAQDVEPWNLEYGEDHPHKIPGTGDWEGFFWVDNTSRDQYTGWWLGLTLAYEAVDDEEMRVRIREDFKDVIDTLITNDWFIVDQNGVIDGNNAAAVLPSLRLSWLLQAASVGADPSYWDLWYKMYQRFDAQLWLDTFSYLNKYSQYFGFNLSHNTYLPIFRLTPDLKKLRHFFTVWNLNVRRWTADTHNAWFDAVYLTGCLRAGACDRVRYDHVTSDILNTLTIFQDAPNQAFTGHPPEKELDPFSVRWDELEEEYPFLREIWDVNPQTLEPHEFQNRCWSDMIWQRSPYSISCSEQHPTRVGPGVDYLIAYWTSFYHGFVPGGCLDRDEDGYGDPFSPSCAHPEQDCDDSRSDVNPGVAETCENLVDDDCDGLVDNDDPDCHPMLWSVAPSAEASPSDPASNPGVGSSGLVNLMGMLFLSFGILLLKRMAEKRK